MKKHNLDCEPELWKSVLMYKVDHGLKNNNAAVVALLELGLKKPVSNSVVVATIKTGAEIKEIPKPQPASKPLTEPNFKPLTESASKPLTNASSTHSILDEPDENEADFLSKYLSAPYSKQAALYAMACKQFGKARIDGFLKQYNPSQH